VNEASNSGNTLALAGAPKLTGSTGDIYFANDYRSLEITGALTGTEIYSVVAATYSAGAPLSTTYTTGYAAKFQALNTYWRIGYSSDEDSSNYQKLIWQKVVTISPNSAQSKIFNGSDPIFTYKSYALGEEINPSSASITGTLTRAAGENVNTYAYTLGSLTAPESYYLVMSVAAPTFTILQRGITIPTIPDKPYNGTSQEHGMPNETAYTFSAAGTDTTEATNTGTYTITATLTNTTNYKWSDDSTAPKSIEWKINPKAITVVPADTTRKIGEANPDFTIELADGSTLTEADMLAYGVNALAHAAGSATFACLDDEDNPVGADSATGTYDITITSLTGSSSNYTVTHTGAASVGTLTVSQDTLGTGDYTITPTGYTPGNWTDNPITLSPAGSYRMIRSVAENGDRGDWVTSLTVQDASASLTFECKTTAGSGAGAISTPKTITLKSDLTDPIIGQPVVTADPETGIITVETAISDTLSGLNENSITLRQGGEAVPFDFTEGLLRFTYTKNQNYTLSVTDAAGNENALTISVGIPYYTLSFAPGVGAEGEQPAGTAPSLGTAWEGQQITLPASPYTLPGYLFCGWELNGKLYAAGDTFSMPGADALFMAVWILEEVWSDATADIIYQNGKQVSHALVNLYLDGELIQQTQSNGSGKFKFKKLKNQVYDIEVIITDEPTNQSQTFKVIVQDKKLISGVNGAEITELVIVQPEIVIEVSEQIRNILPEWSEEEMKQIWEGSEDEAKDALEAEVTAVYDDVLTVVEEYDALTSVKTNQFFDQDMEKWSQLLAITGKVTLTLTIETQMAGVDNPDSLIGLLITTEDLEEHAASNENIQIIFQIKDIPLSVEDEAVKKSLANLSLRGGANQREYKFFEVTIRKIVGEEESIITETPKDIELMFWIPANMQNGSDYVILRDHQGEITALPTRKIGNILYAWSSQFSNYAIAYTPAPTMGGSGSSGSSEMAEPLLPDPAVDVASPKTREQLPVTANDWMVVPTAISGISRRKFHAPAPRRKKL
jgi:hypothetical protein